MVSCVMKIYMKYGSFARSLCIIHVFLHHFYCMWKRDAVRGDFSILSVKFSVNLVIFKILVHLERKATFGWNFFVWKLTWGWGTREVRMCWGDGPFRFCLGLVFIHANGGHVWTKYETFSISWTFFSYVNFNNLNFICCLVNDLSFQDFYCNNSRIVHESKVTK